MDKMTLGAVRDHAARLVDARARAASLAGILREEPASVRVGPAAELGEAADRFVLMDSGLISWPSGLFLRAEFSGDPAGTLAVLEQFSQLTKPIPGLLDLAKRADAGLFTRIGMSFGSGPSMQMATQAADELQGILEGTQLRELEVTVADLLARADRAVAIQRQGVYLSPGAHGCPEPYMAAARGELLDALQMPGSAIDSLDRKYVVPTREVVAGIENDPHSPENLEKAARAQLAALSALRARRMLEGLDVEALKEVTNERLRFKGLADHGIRTVADVIDRPEVVLTQVPGIGAQTAKRMKAAAQTLLTEASIAKDKNIGDERLAPAVALVEVLNAFEQSNTLSEEQAARRDRLVGYFRSFPETLAAYGQPFVLAKTGETFYDQFIEDISWANAAPSSFLPGPVVPPAVPVWEDYLSRPAHYQSLLNALLDSDVAVGTSLDGLSEETIAAIRSLHLNQEHLKDLYLRGYQSFGAKFCLVQNKVILGDEMGLGKTVQAIAAAAHLSSEYTAREFATHLSALRSSLADDQGAEPQGGAEPDSASGRPGWQASPPEFYTALPETARVLVVVPASLIVNWRRELANFSDLEVLIGHGEAKEGIAEVWNARGGVLIMTYEGIRSQPLPPATLVIVDEAHMIKNPAAQRSQAAAKLLREAQFAVLMTGTPMENRVAEFANLVNYLQPKLVDPDNAGTPSAFRKKVAPFYLRRNQVDVLDELPEKVETIDWVDLSEADQAAYSQAIAEGNWMKARQAAMLSPSPSSAKVERIKELVAEATADKRNVLVFSYFRKVLSRLEEEFGARCVGVISGDVAPVRRQQLVDELGRSGNILLAQIGAGGVGLNIQKASVVILAEVQVKPTIEDQAIARAHRMGQTQVVQVHRIVGDETVDERLLEVLEHKRKAFDSFARESDTAAIPDAIDVSEAKLAQQIIAQERERLGLDAAAPVSVEETPGEAAST